MERVGNFRMFGDEYPDPNEPNELETAPAVPLPLIDWLEHTHPNHLPMEPVSDWELGRRVGQQQIIQMLRTISGRRT